MRRGFASSLRSLMRKWPQPEPGEIWIRYQEKLFLLKSGQTLEWPAQGGGRVTVPCGAQEVPGQGVTRYDLVA